MARKRTSCSNDRFERVAMNLQEFDKRLREMTPKDARPFLCEGSPLDCEVFLVGLNPRTTTPFWLYWDVSYGCKKQEWRKAYLTERGSGACFRSLTFREW